MVISATLKKYRKGIFLLLAVFLQNEVIIPNIVKLEHVLKETDVSEGYILSICKDSYGFIWLGTYTGVYRYDGYDFFRPFNQDSESSLIRNKSVHCIYEDTDSNLWFGTETGLFKFDRPTGKIIGYHYGISDTDLSNEHIRTISQYGDKYYLGTYGGGLIIYHSAENRFETYALLPGNSRYPHANRVNGFLRDRQNRVWVATEAGIYTIDTEKKTYLPVTGKGEWPDGKTVNCFYEDQENRIWIGTWEEGLFYFDKETETCFRARHYYKSTNEASRNVRSIMPFDNNNLWLANFWEGLYNYNIETGETTKLQFVVNEPVKNTSLWTMLKDEAGLVWLGGFGSGLFKYSPVINQFKPFPSGNNLNNVLPDVEISAFTEDYEGNVYIGTSGEGVYMLKPQTKQLINILRNSDPHKNIIRILYTDAKNRVWVGAEEYLACLVNGKAIIYENNTKNPESIGKSGVHAVLLDKSENLWAGVWGWGLYMLPKDELENNSPERAKFKRFVNSPDSLSLSDNIIWTIAEDKKGRLYVGTSNSLDCYDKRSGIFHHIIKTTPSSIYIDETDVVWIGTYGDGLIKFTPWDNKIDYFNESGGLPSNIVNGVLKGRHNELIIVTNVGVSRFLTNSRRFISYSAKSDLGIKKMLQHAYYKLANGMVLIGGAEGIVGFNPEQLIDKFTAYPIYVTDIKVFNKSVLEGNQVYDLSNTREFNFSHKDKMISFEFAALDYSSPEKVKYAYRLEGFDDNWIYTASKSRTATYTNLKSGSYIFHVRSTNSEGAWSDNEYQLKINITPPFYLTLFFKIAVACLLIILAIYFYNIKIISIRRAFKYREESLQSKVEHTAMEIENTLLREELQKKSRELTIGTAKLMEKNQVLVNVKNFLTNLQNEVNREVKGKIIELHQLVVKNLDDEINWEKYNQNIDLIQDNFISRFSSEFPEVTHKDLKICAFIRMNKTNQEIADQLNITLRSLEMARYRIRKKVKLPHKINLNDFILKY